eukprot:3035162-Pyramimonas_sp.AAC.1
MCFPADELTPDIPTSPAANEANMIQKTRHSCITLRQTQYTSHHATQAQRRNHQVPYGKVH